MPLGAEFGVFFPAQLSVKVMCKVPETALVEKPPKAPDVQSSATFSISALLPVVSRYETSAA